MKKQFPEYENLNLPFIASEILAWWQKENVFEKSVSSRAGKPPFVFYEGPPSANGMPGIHHVMSRTIKDLFCRYKTLQGFQVKRKAGWDTHGLPVELAVEKELGITKEDIGKKISIDDYNIECRKAVMKYKNVWDDLTKKMGYWVDLENPYITYSNNYIESVWYLLKLLYDKKLLYKGYTIQPYSPAAGTGLSSHELNLPGCYRNVKDNTVVAMFKIKCSDSLQRNLIGFENLSGAKDIYLLAWTTTPWTLPSNTALAIGKDIDYIAVKTLNQYSKKEVVVILAKELRNKYFSDENSKALPKGENIGQSFKGKELEGIKYEQLLPFAQPLDGAEPFSVILGDFVSTEEGTGIVHIAPTFGADDMRAAKQYGISGILVNDENGELSPLVDKRGRFVKEMHDEVWGFAGEFVKEEFLSEKEKQEEFQKQKKMLESKGKIKELKEYLSVDKRITLKLQEEGKLFKKEIYEHNYPHCWRTDKPILYYPLDSWFIKTTAAKERMIELNSTINWKPEHTGTGRFGEWLNNLQDWNLSRSRYWGIPLPIWRTEDGKEEICIGSLAQLKNEMEKANGKTTTSKGLETLLKLDNIHRPHVDEIILISTSGKPMYREKDLIDVWFDSGAMPYAQHHYMGMPNSLPFSEGKDGVFPADFIAEGVDQTRGWFYTLHAIAVLCFDSVAYKNVVSNGLVLDKNGQKMSKRLGNVVNPFETIEKYGADATRWYLITNSQPWDNLKFDAGGIAEVQKKIFRALYNSYAFFALYANIDNPSIETTTHKEGNNVGKILSPENDIGGLTTEIDRWIISELNYLIKEVEKNYETYEPTLAGRMIEDFVVNKLSNWYVRLNRRRFWKGEYSEDKKTAYQTLYQCLETIAILAAPIAPFYCEKLYRDLHAPSRIEKEQDGEPISVHLAAFPKYNEALINIELQEKMEIAQKISSLVLSLRKKQNIRVRQPLQQILVPAPTEDFARQLEAIKDLILAEVNVKQMEILPAGNTIFQKKIKPDFKILGPRYGKQMKDIAAAVNKFSQNDITALEARGNCELMINNEKIFLQISDFEVLSHPQSLDACWFVASENIYTVALNTHITKQLKEEGIAREIVNKIQNIRKDKGFEVTNKILLNIQSNELTDSAITNNLNYICAETLALRLNLVEKIQPGGTEMMEVEEGTNVLIQVEKAV